MSEKPGSDAASFAGDVPSPSSHEQNVTARQQGRSQDSQKKNPKNDLAMKKDREAGRNPRATRGGVRLGEGDDISSLPPTRPNQAADRSRIIASQINAPMVGAYRVPGIDGFTRSNFSEAETFTPWSEDLEAGAVSDSRTISLPPTVVAEQVPELVSATAIPENPGETNGLSRHAFFCCGFKCGSIAKDDPDNRSRRGLFLCLAAVLFIVAVVVGVSVAVTSSSSKQDKPGASSPVTSLPTSAPTLLATENLFTTFEYTHAYHGHMFDITAKKDIDIIAMSIHLNSTNPEKIEVWTKEGRYHDFETDEFRWAKIGEERVTGKGENVLTPLSRDLFDPVRVRAGDRQAFYVTAQTESIFFQERMNGTVSLIDYGDATEFGNLDLEINVGTGVQFRFENNGPPNIFNGALDYALV